MSQSPDPITDPQRLAALRRLPLVDSPTEESFDRITRLAARLLQSPASVVTLIEEDRQFFKSCIGLPEPLATLRGSSLTHSFCAFTVRAGETFVIEDARSDTRVKDHPAIQQWGIIAYAGCPIRTRDNQVLGTLCVVDVKPRYWTEDDLLTLQDLAASVESEIELIASVQREREHSQQLQSMVRELSEMDERKNSFLALLAHELRNPLTPIGNAVDLLRFCSNDPQQVLEIGHVLEDQVRQLVRLIDDLMDVSRITRGRVDLQREPLSMHDVLDTSLHTMEALYSELGHELVLRIDRDKPLRVMGDYVRLSQVVTNLLNNACKYTPPGGRIIVSATETDDSVVIAIKDNGVGIPDQHRAAIFDMFIQVERTLKESRGGLGIGLTLVKQLVELHGGSVTLVDAPQEPGSEFVVRLPRLTTELKADSEPSIQQDSAQRRYRVLVIDDVPAIAKMFTALVTAMGHQVTAVNDAHSGLREARELRPDIVFSDICMPEMDGYELARELRGIAELNTSMLVAMTGNGQPEDVKLALEAGFDKHITKPASVQLLGEVFEEYDARGSRSG